MAKGKYGSLISKISGSIGGTTFQNSNSGLIIKNKINKNPKNSISRNNSNSHFQYLSSLYLSLTQAQIATWKKWILFKQKRQYGNNYRLLQPKEAFIKFNYYNRLFGKDIIYYPPFHYTLYSDVSVDIYTDIKSLRLNTSRPLNPNAEILILSLTRKVNNSINNPGSRYRLIVQNFDVGYFINIKDEYERQLGSIPLLGDTIFAKWYLFGFTDLTLSCKWEEKKVIEAYE